MKEHVHDQKTRRRVAVIFPGQGAQHPGMGVGLYGKDPFVTATMDDFFTAAGDVGDRLRAEWPAAAPDPMFDDVSRAQPLLYALGCVLGKTLLGHGVVPDAMVEHSVGELTAAESEELFRGFGLGVPSIKIYSTFTGSAVQPEEASTPAFWAVQMARPVLFWRALDNLLGSADYLLLEAGPRGSCGASSHRGDRCRTLATRTPGVRLSSRDDQGFHPPPCR